MGEQRGGLELPTQPMHNNFVSPVADAHCSQKVGDFQLSGMVEFMKKKKKKNVKATLKYWKEGEA